MTICAYCGEDPCSQHYRCVEVDLCEEVVRTGAALDRLKTEGAQDAHDRAGDALDAFHDTQRRKPIGLMR